MTLEEIVRELIQYPLEGSHEGYMEMRRIIKTLTKDDRSRLQSNASIIRWWCKYEGE